MAFKKNIMDEVETQANQEAEFANNQNIENVLPGKQFRNFDEFFMDYSKNKDIKKEWKDALIMHIKAIDCFDKPEKWVYACEHFGF